MNRREAMLAFLSAPVLAHVATGKRYGYLHVSDSIARGYVPARVLLDGVDVSMRCRECDDVNGYAVLYVLKDGKPFVANGGAVTERVSGRVEFTPRWKA